MIRVALSESHPVMHMGLAAVIGAAPGFQLVDSEPHILLADRPTIMGGVKVVVFAAHHAIEAAILALDAGVSGYILKTSTPEEILRGLRAVYQGDIFISDGFATKVMMAMRDTATRRKAAEAIKLNAREEQIVNLLLHGRSNKEIGRVLEISEMTVKHYMSIIMQKLNARNRVEVVLAAQKMDFRPREKGELQ